MRKIQWFLLLGALFFASCQRDNLEYAAQSENVSGQKEVLWLIKNVDNEISTRAVGVKSKYWNPEDTIRVKFLSGDAAFQEKVKEYAALWLQHTSLTFQYVAPDEQADVKIGFDTENRWVSWSTIGTDCKAVPQNEVSLNYVWWDGDPEALIKSEILRGIGHVLGLGFEHRNPNSNVVFKATADVAGEYNLSDAEVEEFKRIYTTAQSNYTAYDKSSVMLLPIPRTWVMAPNQSTTRNSELSEMDKQFVKELYPFALITMKYVGDMLWVSVGTGAWVESPYPSDTRKVDWGDGQIQALKTDDYYSHSYRTYGERTVRFYGADTVYRLFYVNGGVSSIDVTRNKELQTFYCNNGTLKSVDLSQNPKLKRLSLYTNQLTSLDLSHNPKITQLDCDDNEIASLDISPCPDFFHLTCRNNRFTTLDILNHDKLNEVYCYNNPYLETLNVSGNNVLNILDCRNSGVKTLNISSANLSELYCMDCKLGELKIGFCPKLNRLECPNNKIPDLDVSKNHRLKRISCSGNGFSDLYFAQSLWTRDSTDQGTLICGTASFEERIAISEICQKKYWYASFPSPKAVLRTPERGWKMPLPYAGRMSEELKLMIGRMD